MKQNFDLEDRLISFAARVVELTPTFHKNSLGKYMTDQMDRSSNGAALNYGEAQAAESKRDFAHKTQVVLKELRETQVALKISARTRLTKDESITTLIDEVSQLVAIFTTTIKKVKHHRD